MATGNKGGRPPKPTQMKVLHGQAKKDPQRINRNEPIAPEGGEVAPPEEMSDEMRAVWDRLAPSLIAAGVLTYWDIDAFVMACAAIVDYHRARRMADQTPPLTQAPNGGLQVNPALRAMREAEDSFIKYGGRFGLNPSDRSRIKVETAGGPDKGKDAARLLS